MTRNNDRAPEELSTGQIVTGDCLDVLPQLPARSVDLIVTSPPYPGQRGDRRPWWEWCDWFEQVIRECRRVLATTGVMALNFTFSREDGWYNPRPFIFIYDMCIATSMHLVDIYAWHKPNPIPCGNLARHDIPAWEPVFVLAKSANYAFYPVRGDYSVKTVEKAVAGNMRSNGVAKDYTAGGHHELNPAGARQGNVLTISSSGDQGRPRAAGGSFPLALPERFILQHTRPGDVVLDPCAGMATTCRAAQKHGRRWLGIEIDEVEAVRARQWLAEPYALQLFKNMEVTQCQK